MNLQINHRLALLLWRVAGRNLIKVTAGLTMFCAIQATAQITVTDDGFSLSPDPVNIVTGMDVFWMDDGTGPYAIISDTGAWRSFFTPGGLLFNQPGTYDYHDDAGNFGTVNVSDNIPPSVSITNPAMNAVLAAPATFVFGADASDSDADGLSDVEFYVGTNLVDDVFAPGPFTTTVTNLSTGTYSLTAIAYDNAGAKATNSISITVGTVPLPPTLVARQVAHQIVISWDTNNATGLSLQSTPSLAPGAAWTPVTYTPVLIGSQFVVTNPIVGTRQFFRLSNH